MELGRREFADLPTSSGPEIRDLVKALKTMVWLAMGLVAACDVDFSLMVGKSNLSSKPSGECLSGDGNEARELERLREEIAGLTLQLSECMSERPDFAPAPDVYDDEPSYPEDKYLPPPGPAPQRPTVPSKPGGTGDADFDYLDDQMRRDVYRGTPPAQPAPAVTPPPKQNDIGTLDIL